MENASQALIIAAMVLVGVMLLTVYNNSMRNTETYTGVYTRTLEAQELDKYNSEFMSHQTTDLSDPEENRKSTLDMYEVVSLMNKALYIDQESSFSSAYGNYIKVNLNLAGDIPPNTLNLPVTITANNDDFFQKFLNSGSFNYRNYQDTMYKLLNYYYDDMDKGPKDNETRFKMSVKTNSAGYVSEITFKIF